MRNQMSGLSLLFYSIVDDNFVVVLWSTISIFWLLLTVSLSKSIIFFLSDNPFVTLLLTVWHHGMLLAWLYDWVIITLNRTLKWNMWNVELSGLCDTEVSIHEHFTTMWQSLQWTHQFHFPILFDRYACHRVVPNSTQAVRVLLSVGVASEKVKWTFFRWISHCTQFIFFYQL